MSRIEKKKVSIMLISSNQVLLHLIPSVSLGRPDLICILIRYQSLSVIHQLSLFPGSAGKVCLSVDNPQNSFEL